MFRDILTEPSVKHALKLSKVHGKPISTKYWTNDLIIGVENNSRKLLVKCGGKDYTEPITKFYKCGNEYIAMSESTIYIIDSNAPIKKVSRT